MITLLMPRQAHQQIAAHIRARRLATGLTQAGLSARSGVPLGTVRKFERTGLASIEALLKILVVVGGLDELVEAIAPKPMPFDSIDDVIKANQKPVRKNGWRV